MGASNRPRRIGRGWSGRRTLCAVTPVILASVYRRAAEIALARPGWTHRDLAKSLDEAATELGLDSREVAPAAAEPLARMRATLTTPFKREAAVTTFRFVADWFAARQTSPG